MSYIVHKGRTDAGFTLMHRAATVPYFGVLKGCERVRGPSPALVNPEICTRYMVFAFSLVRW